MFLLTYITFYWVKLRYYKEYKFNVQNLYWSTTPLRNYSFNSCKECLLHCVSTWNVIAHLFKPHVRIFYISSRCH